jgi:hypothetical protein
MDAEDCLHISAVIEGSRHIQPHSWDARIDLPSLSCPKSFKSIHELVRLQRKQLKTRLVTLPPTGIYDVVGLSALWLCEKRKYRGQIA